MNNLLAAISKKILYINQEIKKKEKLIDEQKCFRATLELCRFNPDDVDYDDIRKMVSDSYLEDLDYVSKFKGWFSDYKEEPQIIKALEKYERIINSLQEKCVKVLEQYSKELEELSKEYELLIGLKEKIKTFDIPNVKNAYITEEEFILIDRICGEELETDEIIEIYIRIGKSNSNIENENHINEELSKELGIDASELERMSQDRTIVDNSYEAKFEKLLKSIENYVSNIDNIIENEELRKYVVETFRRLDDIKLEIDNESYELAELFKSSLEGIDAYPEYTLSIILILIDLLDSKDYAGIAELKEKHINSGFYDYSEFREQQDILSRIQEIIDEYYEEEEYLNYRNSYCLVSNVNEYVTNELSQTMRIMAIIHDNISNLQNMKISELSKLLSELEKEIEEFKNISKKEAEEEVEQELEGLDIADVENYVIIRDKEKLQENIESIMSEHIEVTLKHFLTAMHKLFMMPSTTLFNNPTCKPIMVGKNRKNKYGIREERGGAIRICFRTATTINGHVVFELLSFAYGSCGEKKKYNNLLHSVKEYGDHIDEYDKLESLFQGSDVSKKGQEIVRGIEFYNNLVTNEKNKNRGGDLNA